MGAGAEGKVRQDVLRKLDGSVLVERVDDGGAELLGEVDIRFEMRLVRSGIGVEVATSVENVGQKAG